MQRMIYDKDSEKWKNYIGGKYRVNRDDAKLYLSTNFSKRYEQMLDRQAELILKLCGKDYTNPGIILAVYYNLLWNGYFSKNKKFVFSSVENKLIEYGVSILDGEGVCLNIASHFKNILRRYKGFYSFTVGVRADDIEKKTDNINNTRVDEGKTYLDHLDVLLRYNGKFFMLDPTNCCIYQIELTDNEKINRIDLYVGLSYSDFVLYNQEKHNGIDFINEQLSRMSVTKVDDKLSNYIKNRGIELCEQNKEEIDKFYDSIKTEYERLSGNVDNISRFLEINRRKKESDSR